MAHAPALTAAVQVSALLLIVPSGGVACPRELLPQQTTVPSVFTPQVWLSAALTWVKLPAGGVARPSLFEPQQARVLLALFTPHVWLAPALTWVKLPAGGVASP